MSRTLATLATVRHRVRAVQITVVWEPRDLWVGVFIGPWEGLYVRKRAVYLCLVPMVVLKVAYLHGVNSPIAGRGEGRRGYSVEVQGG